MPDAEVVSLVDQVAARAAEIRFTRALLTLLASPFYVIGVLVGFLWVAVTWALAAAQVGMVDARDKASRRRDL